MREMHFGQDGNFSEQALVQRFNADLANDLGNLFNRSLAMNKKYHQAQAPAADAELQAQDQDMIHLGLRALENYVQCFQSFEFDRGLESIWELVRGLNRYIDSQAPWELYKQGHSQRLGLVMAIVLTGLRKTALALWPVMPDASNQLCWQLGFEFKVENVDIQAEAAHWDYVSAGTVLATKSKLFPRQEQPVELQS